MITCSSPRACFAGLPQGDDTSSTREKGMKLEMRRWKKIIGRNLIGVHVNKLWNGDVISICAVSCLETIHRKYGLGLDCS
jgi:hypothetical protein